MAQSAASSSVAMQRLLPTTANASAGGVPNAKVHAARPEKLQKPRPAASASPVGSVMPAAPAPGNGGDPTPSTKSAITTPPTQKKPTCWSKIKTSWSRLERGWQLFIGILTVVGVLFGIWQWRLAVKADARADYDSYQRMKNTCNIDEVWFSEVKCHERQQY